MSPPASVSTAHPFGALLRQLRTARTMSQLALALEADISARHLSFLETGRAQPSRDMVLLLATSLDKYPTKSFLTQCCYNTSSTSNRFAWRIPHDLMR